MVRVRREVWSLASDPDDETLHWYAIGVGRMRARGIDDHRSWRFQAAIHEYVRERDPLRIDGEAVPSRDDQEAYWTQCQHTSWFFLPWHRMYLHHFESIIRLDIIDAGGPADWALPYWNYAATGHPSPARSIPPAFRQPFLADGTTPNPLFVAARAAGANDGLEIVDELGVDASAALEDPLFSDGIANGAFGGPETGFMHGGGDVVGKLEVTPHGDMHMAVGGTFPFGWMSRFSTAALDPLFWLHHANIDRLWEVWLRRSATHTNPSSPMWRDTAFHFRNVEGRDVTMTPAGVADTTAPPLEYRYDDVGDPLGGPVGAIAAVTVPMSTRHPDLLGATERPFEIGASAHRADVPTPARAATAALGGPSRKRVFLHFEHLTSRDGAPPYDVYVGVPEGEDPRNHPDKRIGRLPMFGLVETSSDEGPHAGSGLTYSLEVTHLLDRLRATPGWDPDRIPVTFVPITTAPEARVRVGRVSVYSE